MMRQLWITFSPGDRAPGTYRARVDATAAGGAHVSVPVELRVLRGSFPSRPSLHVGGWDYSDADRIYGLTPNNRAALVRQLRQLHVDAPWARSATFGAGAFDSWGRLQTPPDTSSFDAWITNWPDAARYMVFVNVKDALGNVAAGDARFATAVAQWIRFWTAHAAGLNHDGNCPCLETSGTVVATRRVPGFQVIDVASGTPQPPYWDAASWARSISQCGEPANTRFSSNLAACRLEAP